MPGVIFRSGLPGVRRFKIRRCQNSSIILKLLSINVKRLLLKAKYVGSMVERERICHGIVQKCKSVTWYTCSFTHPYIRIPECVPPVCTAVCLCVHLHISVCRICWQGSMQHFICSGAEKTHGASRGLLWCEPAESNLASPNTTPGSEFS